MYELRLRAVARATAGDGTTGAQLRLWRAGRWEIVDSNTAADDAGTDLVWSSASAGDVEEALFRGDVHFGVQPTGTNGTGTAVIASDHFEVEVRYRLPPP